LSALGLPSSHLLQTLLLHLQHHQPLLHHPRQLSLAEAGAV
jgi:hypothetical protein